MGVSATVLPWVSLLAAQAATPHAASQEGQRSEVPIREVVLSDGTHRYGVSVVVGTAHIEAGLDTGSTGLRVLSTGLKDGDVQATRATDYMEFGGGARLEGSVANASVAIGALSGTTTVQVVQRASCTGGATECAASAVPFARYRVMGGSRPGEGFGAVLGVNMGTAADVANPLVSLGARRWIIDLPRPGDPGSGRLVLNPTDAEAASYTPVEIVDSFAAAHGSLHDALRGCIVNETSHEKVCGAVVLDTGDPGLRVVRAAQQQAWQDGTPVTLFFADAARQVHVALRTMVGSADQATRFVAEHRPGAPQPFILSGVLSYLAYSILYDPEHQVIGFKARPVLAGAPRPFRIN